MNEEILAEFLLAHKVHPDNYNSDGHYDPNPYWLAEDIMKLFNDLNEKEIKK